MFTWFAKTNNDDDANRSVYSSTSNTTAGSIFYSLGLSKSPEERQQEQEQKRHEVTIAYIVEEVEMGRVYAPKAVEECKKFVAKLLAEMVDMDLGFGSESYQYSRETVKSTARDLVQLMLESHLLQIRIYTDKRKSSKKETMGHFELPNELTDFLVNNNNIYIKPRSFQKDAVDWLNKQITANATRFTDNIFKYNCLRYLREEMLKALNRAKVPHAKESYYNKIKKVTDYDLLPGLAKGAAFNIESYYSNNQDLTIPKNADHYLFKCYIVLCALLNVPKPAECTRKGLYNLLSSIEHVNKVKDDNTLYRWPSITQMHDNLQSFSEELSTSTGYGKSSGALLQRGLHGSYVEWQSCKSRFSLAEEVIPESQYYGESVISV